jgi:hypothetical protein
MADSSCLLKKVQAEDMSAFESWIGKPVVVLLTLGRVKLSIRGMVLNERTETLLMRPQYGPELEICKTKVLAIEEAHASLPP